MGKMTTASDVMKNVSNGTSVSDAVKNLTGNDTSPAGYAQAVTNLTSVAADLLNKLPKTAASANLLADLNKIYADRDKTTGDIKISNVVSFVADFSSFAANFLPAHLKFSAYAISAGLTALSWGLSNLEDASEADKNEKERLQKLFEENKAELDKTWDNKDWNDEYNLALLYEVSSARANENKWCITFKIHFNHTLDKEFKMSYYTIGDSATQDVDYVGVSDKNPQEFTVPAGVNEWFINVPIKDDNEKEKNEEFMIVVNDERYFGKYPFVYGHGKANR